MGLYHGTSDYYAMEDYKSAFMKDDVDLYETVLAANANDDGYVPVTDEVVEALQHIVAVLHAAPMLRIMQHRLATMLTKSGKRWYIRVQSIQRCQSTKLVSLLRPILNSF